MEGHKRNSSRLVYSTDSSDGKYVSEVSTVMVAYMQEAKDRIAKIEDMFCRQLFPKFQMSTRSHHQIYSEAIEAAEVAYREKEEDLLHQIKKLQLQNQQVLEDNKLLKLERAQFINTKNESCNRCKELQALLNQKTLEANERMVVQENLQKLLESKSSLLQSYQKAKEELEEKNKMLLKIQKKLELDTEGLREELMKKSKDIDDTMELQNKLLKVNQSNSSLIMKKENQLKECEETTNGLMTKLEKMESKVNELLSELRVKIEEVEKGKELQGNLFKKIEFQATEIMNSEQLSNKYEQENRHLASKVTSLINSANELQKELGQKTSELEEVRKARDQLLLQIDSKNIEIVKTEQALEEFREENKQLLDKRKFLELKVDKLQQTLSERTKESSEVMELHTKLLQQIEVKDAELAFERREKMKINSKYKSVVSQYNFLLKKCNLTVDDMLPFEGKDDVMRHNQTPRPSHDIQKHTSKASPFTCDLMEAEDKQEVLKDRREAMVAQRTSPASPAPTSRILAAPKCPSSSKPSSSTGTKRPHSYWRDTRSHQSRVGSDPHDDFLDTPLQNVRDNLGKATKEARPDCPKPSAINMRLDDSDDQTQDISVACKQNKQQKSSPRAGTSGFKYVEPVRKKSERENLKGVECKQCKKFYDAVLPGGGDGDKENIRCEHQEGVSRHRYRYAPPSTPEGFWNIGFESEM